MSANQLKFKIKIVSQKKYFFHIINNEQNLEPTTLKSLK